MSALPSTDNKLVSLAVLSPTQPRALPARSPPARFASRIGSESRGVPSPTPLAQITSGFSPRRGPQNAYQVKVSSHSGLKNGSSSSAPSFLEQLTRVLTGKNSTPVTATSRTNSSSLPASVWSGSSQAACAGCGRMTGMRVCTSAAAPSACLVRIDFRLVARDELDFFCRLCRRISPTPTQRRNPTR